MSELRAFGNGAYQTRTGWRCGGRSWGTSEGCAEGSTCFPLMNKVTRSIQRFLVVHDSFRVIPGTCSLNPLFAYFLSKRSVQ
eukprot:3498613-Amphidinium_carterae.1